MSYEDDLDTMLRDESIAVRVTVREIGKQADKEISRLKEGMIALKTCLRVTCSRLEQSLKNDKQTFGGQ